LKSNPYYFGSAIYAPKSIEQGGPFTMGRVIHSNRPPTPSAWIGGVAVFDRAFSEDVMRASICTTARASVSNRRSIRVPIVFSPGIAFSAGRGVKKVERALWPMNSEVAWVDVIRFSVEFERRQNGTGKK